MVNKEFFISGGSIIKDFSDRNIPQNSHNFVKVSVCIPTSVFENNNYAVELSFSKQLKGQNTQTTLPSLVCASAKTIKVDNVEYIKWSCLLTKTYTNFIGTLYVSPYLIQSTKVDTGETDDDNEPIYRYEITKQATGTTTQLNVIKSVENTTDATIDETGVADYLLELINSKKIKVLNDEDGNTFSSQTIAQAIATCFTDYNATYYDKWLLIVRTSEGEIALFPKLVSSATEYTKLDLTTSKFSRVYNYDNGTYDEVDLSYSKAEINTKLEDYYLKTETYSDDEIDTLLDTKVDKTFTISGKALSGSGIQLENGDVGLGNVKNYGYVLSPSADANDKVVRADGLYAYLQNNFYNQTYLNEYITKINELYALYKDATPDNDSVVNTLYDLIKVFENFDEADNVASILSGLDSRLDLLESENNVVINCGGATIETTDWTSNSGDYSSDYPYKATITDDNITSKLIGASNFDVIFSVNADTSLLSTTAVLNNETGVITFYASETPSEDIVIDNIVAFTNLNAINTLTTDTINQVNQNKNDISDLQSTKISKSNTSGLVKNDGTIDTTTYVKETNSYYNNGTYTKYIENKDNGASIELRVVAPDYTNHQMYATGDAVCMEDMYKATSTKKLVSSVLLQNGKAKIINSTWESGEKTAEHTLEFDEDGNLKIDGNAVGGGGSQLYQHNIRIRYDYNTTYEGILHLVILNDNNTPFDKTALIDYLTTNNYTSSSVGDSLGVLGGYIKNISPNQYGSPISLYYTANALKCEVVGAFGGTFILADQYATPITIYDKPIAI